MQAHRMGHGLRTGVLVVLLLGLLLPGPAATQSVWPPVTSAPPVLCQYPAPSGGEVSILNAVTGVPYYGNSSAPRAMWAVGYAQRQTISAPTLATLTLYFNGQKWQVVPSPNVAVENVLTGVAARAVNDVWAVGYSHDGSEYRPLILHFNGSAWTVWHEPARDRIGGPWDTRLLGVQVLTGGKPSLNRPQPQREAVAVGYSESMHGPIPVVLYYDGSTWKPMTLPLSMDFGRLTAVTGTSLDDLWAVGTLLDPEGAEVAHLFHRTAEGWTPIAKGWGTLSGVAVSGDRVFTVGHVQTFTGMETLVMAYTRSSGDWSQIKSFNKLDSDNVLTAITANGDKVYAVGYTTNPTNDAAREALALAYDGQVFAPMTAPNPDKISELHGAVVHFGMLWAVGTTGHGAQRSSLVLNNNCVTAW